MVTGNSVNTRAILLYSACRPPLPSLEVYSRKGDRNGFQTKIGAPLVRNRRKRRQAVAALK